MEETEDPTEHLQEEIHHHAHEGSQRWFTWVALSSALLAVFAAVTSMLSGHHANEAMIEQIQASDHWSYYQAKSIKATLRESMGTSKENLKKIEEYKKEEEEISKEAKEKETSSQNHLHHHEILARGVAFFQIAIGIAAISVLTRRRRFWYLSMALGCLGLVFLIQGLL